MISALYWAFHVGEAGYERPAAVLAAASMDARIGTGF
jgi:hypothetical protein